MTRAIHTAPPSTPAATASASLRTGSVAPTDFTLPRLGASGEESLGTLTRGRPAVVNFFASWCPLCVEELAGFATTSAQDGTKVAFVGIDENDSAPRTALADATRAHVAYPLVADTGRSVVGTAFGLADGLPATFVLDRAGRVRAEFLGQVSPATLRAVLAKLLR